jgi:urease alpha subunit
VRDFLALNAGHAESKSGSAITHGISNAVGQVAVGTLADLVLWKPENFGAKPEMVLKSGVIVWSQVSCSARMPLHHSLLTHVCR